MPFFIRKSVRFGPLRLNLSKSGVGVSGGVRGLRVGAGPRGRYIHAGRGGMYYRKTISGPKGVSPRQPLPDPPPAISRAHELELEEIDSGDVLVMADSSASDLLTELNKKQRAVRFWPLVLLALVGLGFLVESEGRSQWQRNGST